MFLREGNSPDHHLAITYHQLLSQVCRCANVLKQMGENLKSKKNRSVLNVIYKMESQKSNSEIKFTVNAEAKA